MTQYAIGFIQYSIGSWRWSSSEQALLNEYAKPMTQRQFHKLIRVLLLTTVVVFILYKLLPVFDSIQTNAMEWEAQSLEGFDK